MKHSSWWTSKIYLRYIFYASPCQADDSRRLLDVGTPVAYSGGIGTTTTSRITRIYPWQTISARTARRTRLRNAVGGLTGNTSEQVKGKAKEMEGKAQRKVGEGESKVDRNT
jgi:hypothetical protein